LFLKITNKLGRIFAIDYGKQRIGIAVTDSEKIIASGLTTLASPEIFKFIEDYLKKEIVERFVVGYPKTLRNEKSEATVFIDPFLEKLQKKYPHIPISLVDERFTSKIAFQTMIDGGVKKMARRNKALIDKISATIILQSYLESISYR
jgi:putative holliday junction resolvase